MRRFIFIFSFCISLATQAQNKSELPTTFFDNFHYILPNSFNYKDSLQLRKQIQNISDSLYQLAETAITAYRISDSFSLFNLIDIRNMLQTLLNKNQKAIDGVLQTRQLKPVPDYSSPYGIFVIAYNKAALENSNDRSPVFLEKLVMNLKQEYNKVNPDFRNDIINQAKGRYTAAYTETAWKNLSRVADQAIGKSNSMLSYQSATALINTYWNYYLRKNYQPAIENLLYSLSPARVKEEKVKIPMRDGVRLSAYVYRNEVATEKEPAIISLSPYPSGSEGTRGNVFATNGYVYVYVDNRGRRESEGSFIPYEDDARDFYDIIDWVSKQPWCNGKVATSGGSYLGFTQWQAIRKEYKHPALKAINPMVAVGFGVDFPRSSNTFYPYILQWATYVSGKELNDALFNDSKFWNDKAYDVYKNRIPFYKSDSVAGLPNAVFQKWISHPDFDGYWKNILPKKEDYATLDIPVFSITGYYDADQNGALYYYNNHMQYGNTQAKNNHYLLIGPYEHGAAQWQPQQVQNGEDLEKAAQIPIYKYVLQWFDWVLKAKTKPAFIKDKITYFETGSGKWKGATSFKNISKDSLVFYLTNNNVANKYRPGLLGLSLNKPAQPAIINYKHDIAMTIDSAMLFASDQPFSDSLYMSWPYNLVFETAPLKNDIIVSDKIAPEINVMLNVPDADFTCNVYEISPDGKSRNLGSDYIRVRYRNGGEKPLLAKPGEVVQLRFSNLYVYIKKIAKGSKLRFEFAVANNPWNEKNFGFGGVVSHETTIDPRIIEAKIITGGKDASKMVVPFY